MGTVDDALVVLAAIAGAAAVVYGVGLIFAPAAWIVGGLIVVLSSVGYVNGPRRLP